MTRISNAHTKYVTTDINFIIYTCSQYQSQVNGCEESTLSVLHVLTLLLYCDLHHL